jgi:hypothetical protein
MLQWSQSHTHTHTRYDSGLLRTCDRPIAGTSYWQHTTLTTNIHTPAGFEPAIPAIDRPQYYALDCAATGIGGYVNHQVKYSEDSNNDSNAFKGQQVGFRAAFEQINSSFYWVNGTLDHKTKLIRLPAYKPSDRSSVRIAGGCGPMSTEVCLLSTPFFMLH